MGKVSSSVQDVGISLGKDMSKTLTVTMFCDRESLTQLNIDILLLK